MRSLRSLAIAVRLSLTEDLTIRLDGEVDLDQVPELLAAIAELHGVAMGLEGARLATDPTAGTVH